MIKRSQYSLVIAGLLVALTIGCTGTERPISNSRAITAESAEMAAAAELSIRFTQEAGLGTVRSADYAATALAPSATETTVPNLSNVATVYARMTAGPSVSASPFPADSSTEVPAASRGTPSEFHRPQTTIFCPDCQLVDVTGVVDGDTIDTSIGRIRFFGIDTPERGEECFIEAAEFTRLLVVDQVRIQDGPRIEDTYGRRLAYIFDSSGNSIDVQLIAGGFATAWTRDGQHRDVLVGLEGSARSNKAGCLWGEFASTQTTQPIATPSTPPTRVVAVPTPTVAAPYQPVEIDFLRAWGAREPWIPLPASRNFSGWIDETELVFRLYTAIWVIDTANKNGALSRESFISFVSRRPMDLNDRPRQALLALLDHPQGVVDNASWMYEPRSTWEASLGCALAYVEGRKRNGVGWEIFGGGGQTVVEHCDQGATRPPPWISYLSLNEAERDGDWIWYVTESTYGNVSAPRAIGGDPRFD